MQPKESIYPQDWLRIAEKDFARVQTMLSAGDAEAAGFYLQQAVEKFLKAFLLSKNLRLQRIHDLEPLLNTALGFNPSFEKFRETLQLITGFYFVERYPLVLETGITEEDVRNALDRVRPMVEVIRRSLAE
jgi:HEPN domain-containing protein